MPYFYFCFFQPFKASSKPSRWTVLLLIASTWAISLFLALLPFANSLQYVFTDRAVVPDNLFFENVIVRFDAAKDWAEKLLTFAPQLQSASRETAYQIQDATTWSDLQAAIRNASVASILEPQSFIGYEYEMNTISSFASISQFMMCLKEQINKKNNEMKKYSVFTVSPFRQDSRL